MIKKQPKLTPWFPKGGVKPVHEGVYISTLQKGDTFYRRWTKDGWLIGAHDPERAAQKTDRSVLQKDLYWRGLAVKP